MFIKKCFLKISEKDIKNLELNNSRLYIIINILENFTLRL